MNINHRIVMYSSGISSWAAAKRVSEKYGNDNLILLFADTQIEDKDNYRFLHESSKNIGGTLIVVRDEKLRTPWDVINEKKWLSHRTSHCSVELKVNPCKKYIIDNFQKDEIAIYFGIDWQEYERMNAIIKNWINYASTIEAPLCWGDNWLDSNQCKEWAKKEGLKIPRLYDLGFSHSNCGGFCIKAGKKHFRNLYNKLPEVYKYHEEKEQEFRKNINRDDIAILREQKNNRKKSISLKDFRLRIESQPKQLNLFNDEALGGCGCFIEE